MPKGGCVAARNARCPSVVRHISQLRPAESQYSEASLEGLSTAAYSGGWRDITDLSEGEPLVRACRLACRLPSVSAGRIQGKMIAATPCSCSRGPIRPRMYGCLSTLVCCTAGREDSD